MLTPYRKAVVSALVAVAYAGLLVWQVQSGNGFQATDLFPVTAAVGGALLTYLVPLSPDAPHLKTVVAGVLQAVAAVAVLFQNGGTGPNVTAVLLAVFGTVVVHKVKYEPAAANV
jgi:hypothetical protein